MALLCTPDDLKQWLLADYISAAESITPELMENVIASVSGEITEILAYRYVVPFSPVPAVVRNIASVFSAYRIVEAVTGIVDTENSAENVWLPLQKEYKRMDQLLQDIAKGVLKLNLPELHRDREDASVAIISNPQEIDLTGF